MVSVLIENEVSALLALTPFQAAAGHGQVQPPTWQ